MAWFVQSPLYLVVLGMLCGIVGFRMGWRFRHRSALPLAQGLLGFFAFAASWRVGGAVGGALAEGGWALGASLVAIPTFRHRLAEVDRYVIRGRPYRESMLDWLRTGRGPESRPWRTALVHLVELAVYLVAAVVSANLLAIVMGAVLLNYMNAYVAALLAAARRPWTVRLLSWNCWSLIRVAAYIMLGSAFAAPVASWLGYPARTGEARWLLWLGGAGVVLDLVLKLALSRPCGRRLAAAVDPALLGRMSHDGSR